eukprot:gene42305-52454_t
MLTVVAFIVALGLLIAVHEYGHYRVAVACGVKVLRFSVGFGKTLYRWQPKNQKNGQTTEFVIGMFPLGGYVKMLDEREGEVPADQLDQSFNRKSVRQRIAIVAAGPIANFLLRMDGRSAGAMVVPAHPQRLAIARRSTTGSGSSLRFSRLRVRTGVEILRQCLQLLVVEFTRPERRHQVEAVPHDVAHEGHRQRLAIQQRSLLRPALGQPRRTRMLAAAVVTGAAILHVQGLTVRRGDQGQRGSTQRACRHCNQHRARHDTAPGRRPLGQMPILPGDRMPAGSNLSFSAGDPVHEIQVSAVLAVTRSGSGGNQFLEQI